MFLVVKPMASVKTWILTRLTCYFFFIELQGDFEEEDLKFQSRPRGGRKPMTLQKVDDLFRKRVIGPKEGQELESQETAASSPLRSMKMAQTGWKHEASWNGCFSQWEQRADDDRNTFPCIFFCLSSE